MCFGPRDSAVGTRAWGRPWSSAKTPARPELKHTGLSFWGAFAWAQKVISAAQWSGRVHWDLGRMTRLNWRFVIFSDASRRLALTEEYHRCQFTLLHFQARLLIVEVVQTSASAVLLKQQRLLVSLSYTRRMWNICFCSWQSRSVYRFAISECNLSKWGCDLFAVVCSGLKGHISGQKRRLKGSTSLRDPLKSIQGMKTLLSPLRLRDQFSFIQCSSENCNLKFVNAESWARRQMRIIFSFSKDTAETE